MIAHYDALEMRDPAEREAELFSRLPDILRGALAAPAYAERFRGLDPASVTSRAALARLPVLRKSELPALHKAAVPFGGFVAHPAGLFARLFTSPGPIFEPEGRQADPWRGARALFAAGFRPGDIVLNTFSYHLTPGGFIFDSSARALGCAVIPAGPGNTEQQFELIEAYRPIGYSGTPDFLKILLDAAAKLEDLLIPSGNRLERWKGRSSGRHSIRVNDQYRVTFRWENGNAYEVRVEDYH